MKKGNDEMIGIKSFYRENGKLMTGGVGGSKKTVWKKNQIYRCNGKIELCDNGFHFFKKNNLVFGLNFFDIINKKTELYEIEVLGEIKFDTYKCVTDSLKIIRKINKKEIKSLTDNNSNSGHSNSGHRNSGDRNSGHSNSGHSNSGHSNSGHSNSGHSNSGHSNSGHRNSGDWNSGDSNSGHSNSGDWNSGDRNSGDRNLGDRNSGHRNSGDWNSGDSNSGHRNSGDRNSGHSNSGHRNSGDRNSGHSNSGDRNSGHSNSGHSNSGHWNSGHSNSGDWNSGDGYRNYFCTKTKNFLFDVKVEKIPDEFNNINMYWFSLENKTYKEAWKKCPEEILNIFRNIKEFKKKQNKAKFFKITGLRL